MGRPLFYLHDIPYRYRLSINHAKPSSRSPVTPSLPTLKTHEYDSFPWRPTLTDFFFISPSLVRSSSEETFVISCTRSCLTLEKSWLLLWFLSELFCTVSTTKLLYF